MTIRDLILRNRSYRRFRQEVPVEMETLRELVDLARLSASAGNLQPLKYILAHDPQKNALIFSHLGWAGYLPHWGWAAIPILAWLSTESFLQEQDNRTDL